MRFADVMVFLLIAISLVGCSTGSGAGSYNAQPPVASTGGPYTGHIGSAISFNASGSSDPQHEPLTSYAWNFGDGTTGNGVSPSHTFTAAGAYSVSLTVTNTANLSSSATTTASITAQAPVANAGGPYTAGPNVAVTFDGSASSDPQGEALTYAWNFGDGTTGSGVSPSHTYTATGNYSISLTVTNTSNLSSPATTSASIAFQPPAANAGGPYAGLPNVAVNFNGSGSSDPQGKALTYAWNFGDGNTGNGVSANHTYTAAGNYSASLTVTDSLNLSSTATTTAAIAMTGPALSGAVQSGTQPVSAAHVHLFAANTIGYSQPSLSLLQESATGYEDSYGAYTPTSSNGSFSIPAGYHCPVGSQLYLYASAGTTGTASNSAIGMVTAVGTCGGWNQNATFMVNEVTTIAAAYALAGFATDAIHISSSGSSLAQTGVANAFFNAGNLVDASSGAARSTTIGGLGVVPSSTINTLANILNSCTSASGPSSTTCSTLFSTAKSSGSIGTQASDTATAAINVAHNPGANVPALLALQTSSPPFSPVITSANDLTIALRFGSGALQDYLSDPTSIAIDGYGNVWIGNGISWDVVKLSSSGMLLADFQANGIFETGGIAIDTSENAWITDRNNFVVELSNSGDPLSGSYPYGTVGGYAGYAMCMSQAIAIDGYGNSWVTEVGAGDCILNTINEFSNSGALLSGQGYTSNDLFQPYGIAIDGSGHAWAVNDDHPSVTEFSSSGAVLSGTAGYSSPVLYAKGIAIDSNGQVWIVGLDISDEIYKIVEYSQSGAQLAIYPLNTPNNGYNEPSAIALDGAGNVWTANEPGVAYAGTPSISELSSSGSFVSGSGGYTGGGQLSDPTSLAVDPSGNVWVTNGTVFCYSGNYCNTVVEFIGSAVPVLTPLAAGLPPSPTKDGTSKLATRP
jgi:PKD repeat protein